MEQRARGWCFTINNFSEEEKDKISNLKNVRGVKYIIAEVEHLEEGTPHIQGYVYFDDAKTFNVVKQLVGERAHIEKAKGNPQQNFEYCSKEDTVFVSNYSGSTAKKFSFLEFYKDVLDEDLLTLEEKYPQQMFYHRNKVLATRFANAAKHIGRFEGELQKKNYWIWGETGLGKSRWAESNGTFDEIYYKNFNKWWDGYDPYRHKIVIIEDYPCLPAGNCLVQCMKVWCDRRPIEGEAKGYHIMLDPRRFFLIITSNYPIEKCFENPEDIRPMKRRFKEIHIQPDDLYAQCMIKVDRSILYEDQK